MGNSLLRSGDLRFLRPLRRCVQNAAAQRELDDNFFKLRLWQMPDLLKAIFRSYGNLSDETRAKLPLKQIWTTTSEGDA